MCTDRFFSDNQPLLPVAKLPKAFVPMSCRPPLCNPYTQNFGVGVSTVNSNHSFDSIYCIFVIGMGFFPVWGYRIQWILKDDEASRRFSCFAETAALRDSTHSRLPKFENDDTDNVDVHDDVDNDVFYAETFYTFVNSSAAHKVFYWSTIVITHMTVSDYAHITYNMELL